MSTRRLWCNSTFRALRHFSSAFHAPRRFYKEVLVNSVENKFEVMLDTRNLKTPKGKRLSIESESLALAIAQEWDSQAEIINIPQMRLTGLVFTTIDNPNHETSDTLTNKIVDYLDNDTLLYFASSPKELCELEHENWLPIVDWANQKHKLGLRPSYSVTETATIPEQSRFKLYQYFHSLGFAALNGLLYGVDSIKSVLLVLACLQLRLDVEEAARLANLEQDYQTRVYQKIEGHHDVQELELLSRLSAAVLYIQMCTCDKAELPVQPHDTE